MKDFGPLLAAIGFIAIIIAIIVVVSPKGEEDNLDNDQQEVTQTNTVNAEEFKKFHESEENKIVIIETNLGNIKLELFTKTMPITAGNFVKLAEDDYYNDIIFHRVIPGFMIQGGDPDGNGTGGPGYTIEDEFSEYNYNIRGTISMANAGPNTGGSQFFINLVDNNNLDDRHPVFGQVIEGMDVVDKISQVTTEEKDKPVQDVVMQKVYIVKEGQ